MTENILFEKYFKLIRWEESPEKIYKRLCQLNTSLLNKGMLFPFYERCIKCNPFVSIAALDIVKEELNKFEYNKIKETIKEITKEDLNQKNKDAARIANDISTFVFLDDNQMLKETLIKCKKFIQINSIWKYLFINLDKNNISGILTPEKIINLYCTEYETLKISILEIDVLTNKSSSFSFITEASRISEMIKDAINKGHYVYAYRMLRRFPNLKMESLGYNEDDINKLFLNAKWGVMDIYTLTNELYLRLGKTIEEKIFYLNKWYQSTDLIPDKTKVFTYKGWVETYHLCRKICIDYANADKYIEEYNYITISKSITNSLFKEIQENIFYILLKYNPKELKKFIDVIKLNNVYKYFELKDYVVTTLDFTEETTYLIQNLLNFYNINEIFYIYMNSPLKSYFYLDKFIILFSKYDIISVFKDFNFYGMAENKNNVILCTCNNTIKFICNHCYPKISQFKFEKIEIVNDEVYATINVIKTDVCKYFITRNYYFERMSSAEYNYRAKLDLSNQVHNFNILLNDFGEQKIVGSTYYGIFQQRRKYYPKELKEQIQLQNSWLKTAVETAWILKDINFLISSLESLYVNHFRMDVKLEAENIKVIKETKKESIEKAKKYFNELLRYDLDNEIFHSLYCNTFLKIFYPIDEFLDKLCQKEINNNFRKINIYSICGIPIKMQFKIYRYENGKIYKCSQIGNAKFVSIYIKNNQKVKIGETEMIKLTYYDRDTKEFTGEIVD